jgi:RNA polymerase sigma factor (sigma-70 family)
MKFYAVSNLDIKMAYIANELRTTDQWMHDIFVQTKFFADFQVKKFNLLSQDEDVKQDSYLGLWEAIITYDYHKNFDFYRWAQWNILKKIRNNRRNSKRFRVAKSSIKQGLDSCNSENELYDQEVMLEASYLYRQLIFDNEMKLSKNQLDIILKNIIMGRKLREIASEYSLSIERIRQIRNSGLDKLRLGLV